MTDEGKEPTQQPSSEEIQKESAYEGRPPSGGTPSTERTPGSRPVGGQPSEAGHRIHADEGALRQRVEDDGVVKTE